MPSFAIKNEPSIGRYIKARRDSMSRYRLLKASILGLPLFFFAASAQAQQPQASADPTKNLKPVTAETLRNPAAADWLMWRRTYDGFGYSPLDQVNKDNVKNLKPVWTWSMTPGPTETTPIVHDGVLFLNHVLDRIQALNAATGDLIWDYKRDLPAKLVADLVGGVMTKRNMAIYGDNLYIATSDAHLVALDAKTGKVVWDHTVADWTKGWRFSGGPFIAGGILVQGATGCGNAAPGGCFITGHDVKTGAELWRVHTIAQPGDANFDTWNGLPMESRFGGSAWISGSYDPEQDLVFYGTGQPYPWIAEMNGLLPKKPGLKNTALYTDSTLAIEPKTGKVRWYRQHLETDTWDLDYVYERMLIDLPVGGQTRKAVVTTGKLGIIEAIDRTNGEWLWHKETIPQNVVASIDPKTGEKTINQASMPHIGQTTVNCPADPGGRGWPATAYSPKTGILYMPLNEYCSNTTPSPLDPGQAYTGGGRAIFARTPVPNSDGNIGRVEAVKLADRTQAWSVRTRTPQTGAVLPTGGGVVFGGGWDRWFRAYDDTTGKVLWQTRVNNALNSFPVTYSVNGKQYVAVVAGNGSSHARSLATLTPEIKNPDGGSVLWVFALPD
jgi:alcohol dehydrogenase (cytochrome c)